MLIARYREELRRESDARVALATALGETWEAIAASGLTVTLAVLALAFAKYGDYTSFAPVLGLGVFVTLIAGLTLMPALLALLGRRAFWPRRPKLGDATEHRTWQRIAERVAAAPKRAAAAVALILVLLSLGCLYYSPRFSFTEDFLKNMPSKQGYALLERHFPKGSLAPTTVLIKAPQAPPEFVTGMIVGALSKSPGVAAAFPTGTADDGRLLSFQVILEGDPYSKEALQQVRQLRETARKAAAAGQATALVGGPTAIQADTWELSNRDTLVVAAVALLIVGVILAVLLRALVAPLYLLFTNVLSYLAALGATILITEKLLGWERISYRIPLYMFIFLVALGSDYNIFITTRIRGEAMLEGLRDGTVKASGRHRRRAHQRRHHPRRHLPDPPVPAGQGPGGDQHRRGDRRAPRHVPRAHGARAGADAGDRAQGRLAGAAMDHVGQCGPGAGGASAGRGARTGDGAGLSRAHPARRAS